MFQKSRSGNSKGVSGERKDGGTFGRQQIVVAEQVCFIWKKSERLINQDSSVSRFAQLGLSCGPLRRFFFSVFLYCSAIGRPHRFHPNYQGFCPQGKIGVTSILIRICVQLIHAIQVGFVFSDQDEGSHPHLKI